MVGRGERVLAHALMLLFTVPALWCIWHRAELWPWSHYPMYSRANPPHYRQVTLQGVTPDGREVDLTHKVYWRPFHVNRVAAVFDRLKLVNDAVLRQTPPPLQARERLAGQRRIDSAARYFASRYELGRVRGEHDGPEIRGIRFYRNRWRIESFAANRDTPMQHELIAEITFAPAGHTGP